MRCKSGVTRNQRWAYWSAAASDYRSHPLLGSGAGTYGAYLVAHPRSNARALDGHNLYLETLAELGPIAQSFLDRRLYAGEAGLLFLLASLVFLRGASGTLAAPTAIAAVSLPGWLAGRRPHPGAAGRRTGRRT